VPSALSLEEEFLQLQKDNRSQGKENALANPALPTPPPKFLPSASKEDKKDKDKKVEKSPWSQKRYLYLYLSLSVCLYC
jgi:hypothetical protein